MGRGMRCSATSGAIAIATAVTLVGCTSSPAPPPAETVAASSSGSTAAPSPTAEPIPVGTEVATAVFTAHPGFEAAGSFVVVAADAPDTYQLVPDAISGPIGGELTLLPYALDPGATCADSGFRYAVSPLDPSGGIDSGSPLIIPPDLSQGDPTFFATAVITVFSESDRAEHDCLATVAAAAPVVWTLPPRFPGLAAVDGGARDGAAGAVTTDADGAPSTYTVAVGDTLSGIGERFGLTEEELFSLNPARTPSSQDPSVYADETLNLSTAARGRG
jgi:hypothetical protein